MTMTSISERCFGTSEHSDYVPKGTRTPLAYLVNNGDHLRVRDSATQYQRRAGRRPWLLIPSWTARGVFDGDRADPEAGSRGTGENGFRKRRRRNNPRRANGNLERFISDEIRRCDVCARAILWAPSVERRHFFPRDTSTDNVLSPSKSLAESIPQFIACHLPRSSPLPCSFCASEARKRRWCGSLYCSEECRTQGEEAVIFREGRGDEKRETLAHLSFPNTVPPPKLFFCKNRFSHGSEPWRGISRECRDLIKEIEDSISAIERRFKSICGDDGSDPEISVQTFGAEECALLLATIVACVCPYWINETLTGLANGDGRKKNGKQTVLSSNPDEESQVEEMWVMSRSHRSLCDLLRKHDDAPSQLSASETRDFIAGKNSPFPTYEEYLRFYLDVKRYCLLRVDVPTHPLVSYATETLVSPHALSESERDLALDLLEFSRFSPGPTEPNAGNNNNRADAASSAEESSQSVRSTVLRWRNAAHFAHWLSTPPTSEEARPKRIHALLRRSYFVYSPSLFRPLRHSCAPTLVLTIPDSSHEEGGERRSPLDSLAWLALHDVPPGEWTVSKLDSLEDVIHSRSAELRQLMGKDFACSCIRCKYDLSEAPMNDSIVCLEESADAGGSNGKLYLSRRELKCLADLAMQQGRFDDASILYESVLRTYPHSGDILHARAASHLGRASSLHSAGRGHCQGHFIEAQRLWKEAGSVGECAAHPEISTQVKKQRVYKTNLFEPSSMDREREGTEESSIGNISFTSHSNGKCFVTSNQTPILSQKECQHIIDTAEDHVTKCGKERGEGGWTTSRHYAVPTTDIPLHDLTGLHTWFYQLWRGTIRPLLRRQFKLVPASALSTDTTTTAYTDVFLHDVFLVKYDARKQRYLPPHYDESTHSFILALNDTFKGGGTYIHRLGRTLAPSAGGMLSFSGGELLHSGDPVVEGVRYIIAAFCYVDLVGGIAADRAGCRTLLDCTKNSSSRTPKGTKLEGVFAEDGKKLRRDWPSSVHKNSKSFSFGFAVT